MKKTPKSPSFCTPKSYTNSLFAWKCRWAAIASYLPERTDNDIKNYWNTHLKKKYGKAGEEDAVSSDRPQPAVKGQWERRLQTDIHTAKQALREALSLENPSFIAGKQPSSSNSMLTMSSSYASSAENISRLLQGWMRNTETPAARSSSESTQLSSNNTAGDSACSGGAVGVPTSVAKARMAVSRLDSFSSPPPKEESKPMPLSLLLETWLLDAEEGAGTLDNPVELF